MDSLVEKANKSIAIRSQPGYCQITPKHKQQGGTDMSISGIETAWQSPGMQNRSNFGAAVVEKTMDTLNNASGNSFAPVDKQTFGAAVVNKTFEYMNTSPGSARGGFGDMNQTYDFAKNVLGAYATGKGAVANLTI